MSLAFVAKLSPTNSKFFSTKFLISINFFLVLIISLLEAFFFISKLLAT